MRDKAKEKEETKESLEKNITGDSPVPKGILLAIGGKESKRLNEPENKKAPDNFTGQEILKKFVELIGKENPVIEVITSASSEGDESFEDYKKVFSELGVKRIGH